MRLDDLKNQKVLERPESNKRNIADGAYSGFTTFVELAERDSQFSEDGKRVVLNLKVEVEDDEGETVDLYIAYNYTWSARGKMLRALEKLDVLPEPGASIELEDLVGIPVQVIVENVEKDGEVYSNIVSIKKENIVREKKKATKKEIRKKGSYREVAENEKRSEETEEDLGLDDM